MEDCRIAEYAVLCSDVYVCEHAELRSHCQILPRVILLNQPYPATSLNIAGPVIGECAIISVKAVIWPGVKIGYHGMVAASSEVKSDVPDYMLVRGIPAIPVCDVRRIRMKVGDKWIFPYPWMRHLAAGEDVTQPAIPPEKS
jgi:acetyltransferase-like isoleucine patch superfamily enzyme